METTSEERSERVPAGSSVREDQPPPMPRRVWILGTHQERIARAVAAIEAAGHRVRVCEPGGELGTTIRDFRPDVILIDMEDQPDRGRHAAVQLRADRATRQLPIILVGVRGDERDKTDKAITGPTRRYVFGLDTASVLNAIVVDL
ncbi:MAG: PleD family two-component system response regulator [Planctomycetota bacterium]|jgi:CheY-like chemotaxis protein